MTRKRALDILFDFWGSGQTLTSDVVKEIEAIEKPGESALETVAKAAKLWDNIKHVSSYDSEAIRSIVSKYRAICDIDLAKSPWKW